MTEYVNREQKIAIIGAGASGLTSAYTLKKKGYNNVHIFERLDRVGGKVHSVNYAGNTYEVGAFWASSSSSNVLALAKEFSVPYTLEPSNMKIVGENGHQFSFGEYLKEHFNKRQIISSLTHYFYIRSKFKALRLLNGFENLHPHLKLTFTEFLEIYPIRPLAMAFRPFWIGCGYQYYDKISAMYVLKLLFTMLDAVIYDLVLDIFPFLGDKGALLCWEQGYQSLWQKLGDSLNNIHLNSSIEAVSRQRTNRNPIAITVNNENVYFDKLIISSAPYDTKKFLVQTDTEKSLFGAVKKLNYFIHLIELEKPIYDSGSMLFFENATTSKNIGKITAVAINSNKPNIWTVGQRVTENMNELDIFNILELEIAKFGGKIKNVIHKVKWNYMPHVETFKLNESFYEKFANIQGQNNTFYVGGLLGFESVGNTAAFASDTVNKFF